MIDVSDGLGAEAEHLAAASGVGIEIEVDRVPRGEGVSEVADAAGRDPYELIVSGGEDYELLCVIPRGALADCQDAVEASGTELHEIGRVVTGGRGPAQTPRGAFSSGSRTRPLSRLLTSRTLQHADPFQDRDCDALRVDLVLAARDLVLNDRELFIVGTH